MTEYIAEQLVGDWGDPTDPPLSVTQPTMVEWEDIDFTWRGNFTDPAIVGFKVVGEFSGTGAMFWDWYFESPETPPLWPEPDYSDWSHVGLNNSSSWDPPGWNLVAADHVVLEYVFATSSTHLDPSYAGFPITTPLTDLLISLNANEGTGYSYDHVYGSLEVFPLEGETTASITVHRFDLVLYTEEADVVSGWQIGSIAMG